MTSLGKTWKLKFYQIRKGWKHTKKTKLKISKTRRKKYPKLSKEWIDKIKKSRLREENNPRWKKLSIKNVHDRIIRKFGKASRYKCIDCKKQARDWSNNDRKKYTLNFERYKPRCTFCHRKYDNFSEYAKSRKKINGKFI